MPSGSAEETRALGRRLGELLRPGDIVTLEGPYGAGKTTLVQGVAEGLGIGQPVTSPSFALVNEYLDGRVPLFHLDLYRLGGALEALELDLDAYLARGGALAVEWPEAALELLPDDRLALRLDLAGEERVVEVAGLGPRGQALAEALIREPASP